MTEEQFKKELEKLRPNEEDRKYAEEYLNERKELEQEGVVPLPYEIILQMVQESKY